MKTPNEKAYKKPVRSATDGPVYTIIRIYINWQEILRGPWEEIKKLLLDESEQASAMWQCNPFCGILTPKERWRIYREFRDR